MKIPKKIVDFVREHDGNITLHFVNDQLVCTIGVKPSYYENEEDYLYFTSSENDGGDLYAGINCLEILLNVNRGEAINFFEGS